MNIISIAYRNIQNNPRKITLLQKVHLDLHPSWFAQEQNRCHDKLSACKKHLSYLTFRRSAPITTAEWINKFRYSNSPYVWNMKLKEIFVSERFNEFLEFFSRRLLWTHKFEHKILIPFYHFMEFKFRAITTMTTKCYLKREQVTRTVTKWEIRREIRIP